MSMSPLRYLPASWSGLSRHVFAIGVAGVAAGVLVGGIGGRIAMRGATLVSTIRGATTEAGATVGEFTLAGTLGFVVFIGIASGIFGAVIYAVTRPWLMNAGRWHGAVFGVLLFALTSATSDVLNPDNFDFRLLDNNHLIVLMFFALFVVYGVTIAALFSWLDKRLSEFENAGPLTKFGYLLASVVGPITAIGLLPPMVFIQNENLCDCDPPLVAGIAFLVLMIATFAIWTVGRSDRNKPTVGPLRLIGWAALGVVAIAGTIRAISDVSAIISL